MFENKIRLAKPWIPDETLQKLKIIFKSGWISGGIQSKKFARKIAEVEGYKHGVATNSCTSALQIALELSALDEKTVRIPNITFPSTANAVIAAGYEPFITQNQFDVGVDLFGLKTGNREWSVGDCACSLGSKGGKGKPFISCYSFHARKIITTGEGGALCTDDRELAESALEIIGQGSHRGFAYSMRMSDINAVIGLAQIDLIEEILEHRHMIVNWYNDNLPVEVEIYGQIGRDINRNYNYQTFVITLPTEVVFDNIQTRLSKEGVECNFGTYRLKEIPYYKKYMDLNAEFEDFNYLALPLYYGMLENDVIQVCNKLNQAIFACEDM